MSNQVITDSQTYDWPTANSSRKAEQVCLDKSAEEAAMAAEYAAHEAANSEKTRLMGVDIFTQTTEAKARWQRMMKGASDLAEGFKDYTTIYNQTHAEVADAFATAFDEGGERGAFPNVLLISMLVMWNEDARKQRELALDLAENLSKAELQALYQTVVKATKLQ